MKIACIDIGTNSVRYLAAELSPSGEYTVLQRGLFTPRLGEGLAGSGRLKPAAIQRTIGALRKIRVDLQSVGIERYRAAGTEALRLAENGEIFIRRAREIGLEVEILSGEEEARLVYRGAAGSLSPPRGNTVLADVGGGSTEIITVREDGEPHPASSPLGCVRLREEAALSLNHGSENRKRFDESLNKASRSHCEERSNEAILTKPALQWMRDHCRAVLKERVPTDTGAFSLVGLGGTFTTLAAIKLRLSTYDGEKVHGSLLTGGEIAEIENELSRLPLEKRKAVPGLNPSRADIIIPGIIIVRAVMEYLAVGKVTISDRGILFGMLDQCSG